MTMALEGGEGSASRPGCSLPPVKDPVPIVQEDGWDAGTVWTGAENLAPPGVDARTVQQDILLCFKYINQVKLRTPGVLVSP